VEVPPTPTAASSDASGGGSSGGIGGAGGLDVSLATLSASPLSPTYSEPPSPAMMQDSKEARGASDLQTVSLTSSTADKAAQAGVSAALIAVSPKQPRPHHNARGSIVTFDDFMTEEEKRARNTSVIDSLRQTNPAILFCVSRSKNENIVVYEVISGEHVTFTPQTGPNVVSPVEAYWMKIDPAYVGKNKKVRVPLSTIERTFLFGAESVLVPESEKAALHPPHKDYKDVEYAIELHLLPGRVFYLCRHKKKNHLRAVARVRGNLCELVQIFVSQQERTLQLPKIKYIELVGRDLKTGAVTIERIVPERDQSELLGPILRQQLAQKMKKATAPPNAEPMAAPTVRPFSLAIFR